MCEHGYIATCPKCGTSVLTGKMYPLNHPWMNGCGFPCCVCGEKFIISPETFIPRENVIEE